MKDEIKETINILYEFATNINSDYIYDAQGFDYPLISDCIEELLDYITNLQEENEELREDNFAYHQLMKMQNKREYRSKFLKDFQKEYGENVFPDYDEIYKRYDNYKTKNEKAIELIYKAMKERDITGNGTLNLNELLDVLQGKSDE